MTALAPRSLAGCGSRSLASAMRLAAARQQGIPEADYGAAVSQRLVEAVRRGDSRAAEECLADSAVDVNHAGAVCLRTRRVAVALREEAAHEVRVEYEELRTDASALFVAAHAGDLPLVRRLLEKGADVNQKLFGGHAITAATREGRAEVVEVLLKAGASQPACEEAVVEASLHGRARLVELLMRSDLVRPQVAVHALVSAASRGYADVVDSLLKCGVDVNATSRVLLRSLKPSLHTNVDCSALFAAVVSRQVAVVRRLLQAGVRKEAKVRLGAWSWDAATGEEVRVGAGLSEPYDAAWCAVEYFEVTGSILRMLLQHHFPVNGAHHGRTLLHHAILCANPGAVDALLTLGADRELPVKAGRDVEFQPIHLAARFGVADVLRVLVDKAGCDMNSRTETGETALMLCARHQRDDCLRILVSAGADLGLRSFSDDSATSAAASSNWSIGFRDVILGVIRTGAVPPSSNPAVFSSITFAAHHGDVASLEVLLRRPEINIDEQDGIADSPVMITVKEGHVEAFRRLVFAGADMNLRNKDGETAIDLLRSKENRELFEQALLEFTLERGETGHFHALHFAARRGDMAAVRLLTKRRGCDVNALDGEGYTPLMLAAREGHGGTCEALILAGAECRLATRRGETALSLARLNAKLGKDAEEVILDELARATVTGGGRVKKHTKGGKGAPHGKELRMVAAAGVLRWGSGRRRNIMCGEAAVGGSAVFRRNRKAKGVAVDEPGLFRVVTAATGKKKREVHFVCEEGGEEEAELWVRGIRLMTTAALGKLPSSAVK
ncbi:ankyrin-3-like isoform X1 [Zingiber officinale]|uniref:ankyrin-3-like isoform X1 n=1 Tax=Zingiber officinale TaxID=94328 RepID=UPI001C4A96DA|nr:ankyrin-3-like isoform X1 [Zingiber officinale]